MTTSERLAKAIEDAGGPGYMVTRAREGAYDDYRSKSATPKVDLVRDCQVARLFGLEKRVREGDFDNTREEAEAWAKSPEGRATIGKLTGDA